MPALQFENNLIEYIVEFKKNKKNVTIMVNGISGVKVTAPKSMNKTQIEEIVNKKASWIYKKWKEFEEKREQHHPKLFEPGDAILYLGESFPLQINGNETLKHAKLSFDGSVFIANIPHHLSTEDRKVVFENLFTKWYISKGHSIIARRLEFYCSIMKLYPTKFAVKQQKKRWGTCTGKGALYFNWRLMMAPIDVIDYVVVHELAHLKHFDHSPRFWKLVEKTMPDYKMKKDWLKKNGFMLGF